jgi:hypothetical protein
MLYVILTALVVGLSISLFVSFSKARQLEHQLEFETVEKTVSDRYHSAIQAQMGAQINSLTRDLADAHKNIEVVLTSADREVSEISRMFEMVLLDHANNSDTTEFDLVVIPTYVQANQVLTALQHDIESKGFVSLSDFYELVGIQPNYGDERCGWRDLEKAFIRTTVGGVYIDFPDLVSSVNAT